MINRTAISLTALVAALLVLLAPAVALAADEPAVPAYLVEWLTQLLTPILAALGAWLAAEAIRWLRAHVIHTQSRDALERAVHAVGVAVAEVQQTVVDGLKEAAADGKLTKEEATMVLGMALSSAKEYLGPKGLATLRAVIGTDENALDRYLVGLIEAHVRDALGQFGAIMEAEAVEEEAPANARSKPPPILPSALVLLALPLLVSCQPPRNASDVERAAAVAYGAAAEALVVADTVAVAWMDSVADPTPEQLAAASDITAALTDARDALVVARERLVEGSEALDDVRVALDHLRVLVALLDAAGVQLPDRVGDALALADEVL